MAASPAAAASASGATGHEPPQPQGGGARRSFRMEDFDWGSTLGEGSYARVVHAQLKSNGRHYAIKVASHPPPESERLLARRSRQALIDPSHARTYTGDGEAAHPAGEQGEAGADGEARPFARGPRVCR